MIRKLYKKYKEYINYIIIGILTTVVSLAVYYALVFTVLDPQQPVQLQAANVISWIVSVTFAYFTNRWFVFESKNPAIIKEIAAFFAARLGTLFLDMAFMFVTVTCCNVNDKIAKIIIQVIVIVVNYIFSKFWVFK